MASCPYMHTWWLMHTSPHTHVCLSMYLSMHKTHNVIYARVVLVWSGVQVNKKKMPICLVF